MTDTGEQSYGEEAGGACRMDEFTDQSRRIVTQDESTRKGSQLLAREAGLPRQEEEQMRGWSSILPTSPTLVI